MKTIVLAIVPWLFAPLLNGAVSEENKELEAVEEATVYVTVDAGENGDVATQDIHVVTVGSADTIHMDDPNSAVVVVRSDEDVKGSDGERTIKVITRVDSAAADANRGWLGVALGETVGGEKGVVVMNVVKKSPAEAAGLLEKDVILSVNGEPIEGGVAALAKKIGKIGPDNTAELTVRRGSDTLKLVATLASPKRGDIEWLYAPDVHLKEYRKLNPKIFRFGPDGGVGAIQLDELDELENLPANIAEILSGMGITTDISIGDGKRSFHMEVIRDGNVIGISQEDDGPIVVSRRADGADEAVETEYATPEALEAGDPEAFEVYNNHQSTHVIISGDGDKFDFRFDVDTDDWFSGDVRKRIEIQLKDAEEQMKEARRVMEEANIHVPHIDIWQSGKNAFYQTSKVSQSFKVNPDGQIELTRRKGDAEVVTVYSDEADLEARNPDAYAKYRDVMDAVIED